MIAPAFLARRGKPRPPPPTLSPEETETKQPQLHRVEASRPTGVSGQANDADSLVRDLCGISLAPRTTTVAHVDPTTSKSISPSSRDPEGRIDVTLFPFWYEQCHRRLLLFSMYSHERIHRASKTPSAVNIGPTRNHSNLGARGLRGRS